jgi:NTP pyrophosphatase (non-canonical NTP hydrolase)
MRISDLLEEAHATAVEKGWWDDGKDRNLGELIALCHSELSEALEEIRAGHDLTEIYYGDRSKPEGFAVELADLLIRIADFVHHFGIPLEHALELKLAYNQTRPHKHGKRF